MSKVFAFLIGFCAVVYVTGVVVLLVLQIAKVLFTKKKLSSIKDDLKFIFLWFLALSIKDGREKIEELKHD